jgi:hypothetical protein
MVASDGLLTHRISKRYVRQPPWNAAVLAQLLFLTSGFERSERSATRSRR